MLFRSAAAVVGVPAASDMIASLICRMKESREEYIRSDDLAPAVGAMFLWWNEHCARHAPEHLGADVLVRGGVAEVMVDENMHARGSLQWIDHPVMGRIVLPNSPLIFEGTPRRPIEPNVKLGASNETVFADWLGHSKEDVTNFSSKKVI